MAQFEVYLHPVPRLRDTQPYVVEVQSDLLQGLSTAVLVPLLRPGPGASITSRLNPSFDVAGEQLTLSPPELLSISRQRLGAPIAKLTAHRDDIMAALDRLFTGI